MTRPALLTLFCLALVACGPTAAERAAPVIQSEAGRACTDNGGKLIIRQSGMGQKGFCRLPDGRYLDMWEFFRQINS